MVDVKKLTEKYGKLDTDTELYFTSAVYKHCLSSGCLDAVLFTVSYLV